MSTIFEHLVKCMPVVAILILKNHVSPQEEKKLFVMSQVGNYQYLRPPSSSNAANQIGV